MDSLDFRMNLMPMQAICVSASDSQFAIHNQSTCSTDNTH